MEATFENRRWVFPREDCVLLPIENTTAELIAFWIGGQLRDQLSRTPITRSNRCGWRSKRISASRRSASCRSNAPPSTFVTPAQGEAVSNIPTK